MPEVPGCDVGQIFNLSGAGGSGLALMLLRRETVVPVADGMGAERRAKIKDHRVLSVV